MRLLLVFSMLFTLGAGCGDDTHPALSSDSGTADSSVTTDSSVNPPPPPPPRIDDSCQRMDILFVIDDSGSMEQEQANLVSNFPRFIDVINNFMTDAGSPLDYRIGVTTTGKNVTTIFDLSGPLPLPISIPPTTETGPEGALLSVDGLPRPWIERTDPDVTSSFSNLAQVGTDGASIEMPLLMTQYAVTKRLMDGSNSNFFREDALLAVIILTDEDDCSRTEDEITVTFQGDGCETGAPTIVAIPDVLATLDNFKGERGRWAVSVIAGPGPNACSSTFGNALPATRLRDFVSQVGQNGAFSSICEGDLAGALETALGTFDVACQNFPPII